MIARLWRVLTRDSSAERYDVATDSRRTLLYAKLSRRFPLRMMAPR